MLSLCCGIGGVNSVWCVEDCYSKVIYNSNRMGIEAAATNERTVADWNILLRANREHFPLPDPKIQKQKKLPDLSNIFHEEITVPWIDHCIGNLADLTVEFLSIVYGKVLTTRRARQMRMRGRQQQRINLG